MPGQQSGLGGYLQWEATWHCPGLELLPLGLEGSQEAVFSSSLKFWEGCWGLKKLQL